MPTRIQLDAAAAPVGSAAAEQDAIRKGLTTLASTPPRRSRLGVATITCGSGGGTPAALLSWRGGDGDLIPRDRLAASSPVLCTSPCRPRPGLRNPDAGDGASTSEHRHVEGGLVDRIEVGGRGRVPPATAFDKIGIRTRGRWWGGPRPLARATVRYMAATSRGRTGRVMTRTN